MRQSEKRLTKKKRNVSEKHILITGQRVTLPMHFSKWGANLPAIIDRPQFMQSNISLATDGWVCPKISTTYLPFASLLLLESATLTRACAESLNSSSSSSKLRSRPNLAIRWHSDAISTITESRRSPNKLDESCKYEEKKYQLAMCLLIRKSKIEN